MKKMIVLALGLMVWFAGVGFAQVSDSKKIEELKISYPLKTCVVSGEKLETSDMGEPLDYLHASKDQNGNETVRLVRFCCKSCLKKFKKNPDKYLEILDSSKAKDSARH